MSDFNKRITEKLNDSTFCYNKEGGQGFAPKESCECFNGGRCQAVLDKERYHTRFKEVYNTLYGVEHYDGNTKKRDTVVDIIKHEFKDSKWYKENVK